MASLADTHRDGIPFAGAVLDRYRHVCAFFDSPAQAYAVLLPFITDGFRRGDRAFHIVDPALYTDHVERLTRAGVDVPAALDRGQLEVRTWEQAYLRGGRFDQASMLALIQQVLDEGPPRGFPMTRLVAHMEWALQDRPGVDDLVEYETRLNYILPRYHDPVI